MRLTHEQITRLREEFPEAYEERSELINVRAKLWNALCWYGSYPKKFHGRMVGLAILLRDERRAANGHGEEVRTVMDSVVEQMRRDGWANCHTND